MLTIHTFINTPVPSNTYTIVDEGTRECLIIDPGTKESNDVINFIHTNSLLPKYILLTHGDFDHTWGVNTLKQVYPDLILVASRESARLIAIPQNYFSALYFNNLEYYNIEHVDVIIDDNGNHIYWNDNEIRFVQVPGHTICSNLILLNNWMFSGDTILKGTKPYIQKKHGGNKHDFKVSVQHILDTYSNDQFIYPGHGDPFCLGEVRDFYEKYITII